MTAPSRPTTRTPSLAPVVVRDLTVSYADHTVLRGLDLVVAPGRRTALVGENGSGKSTLLRAVAGRLPPTATVSGHLDAPGDLVHLGQEQPFRDATTIGAAMRSALRPLHRAVAEVERLAVGIADGSNDEDAYAAALERAVALDAWDADRRAEVAAARLGVDRLEPERRVGTLSGGERTRLALAVVMTTRPACLLLDEPTNHLDDAALDVLARFLRDLSGVVLLASHDRVLLDEVATDPVDLEPTRGGAVRFGGGWSAYESHRRAERRRWEETYAAQQEEIARLRSATRVGTEAVAPGRGPRDNDKFVHAFKGARVERTVARRRRAAHRAMEEVEAGQVRKPPPPLRLRTGLTAPGLRTDRVVQVRGLRVGDRLRLGHLDVRAGEHLLVTGPNGAGKSTLLGVLAGRVRPDRGEVAVRAARVAELVQDVGFAEPGPSAERTYRRILGDERAGRTPLRSLGLLRPVDLRTPVGRLSTGQRRRLGLALAVAGEPDLLLLDEPTNHLSLSLVGELEEAVQASPGAVVVASHDRWLRSRWPGSTLELG